MEFGSFIQNRRNKLGLSQNDLAKSLSYTPQAISRFENNSVSISLEMLGKLCQILRISISDFINQVDSDPLEIIDERKFDHFNFTDTLIYLRKQKGLSQKELSEKININSKKLSKLEHGSMPTIEEFINISKFYELSYEELYFSEIPENKETKSGKKKEIVGLSIFASITALGFIGVGIIAPLLMAQSRMRENEGQAASSIYELDSESEPEDTSSSENSELLHYYK